MVEYVLCFVGGEDCWETVLRGGLLGKSPKFEGRIVGKESQV